MLFLILLGVSSLQAEHTRRLALVIGANDGGGERPHLSYALEDARGMARVLRELGAVSPGDMVFLDQPRSLDILEGLRSIREKCLLLKSRTPRLEFLLYYSGHATEQGLLLSDECLRYDALQKAVTGVPAQVRIAILDSCASGAFTRLKGGRFKPPLMEDEANNMEGYAVLTSSASNESSQESDSIRGSFFTYHLMAGLRGAADLSGDGRVSLTEAYHYAFAETLSQTARQGSGPQHPNYHIQMVGTGDVILTQVRKGDTCLELPENLGGRIWLHDAQGRLVMELNKVPGTSRELALTAGRYTLSVRTGDQGTQKGNLNLKRGERYVLHPQALTTVTPPQVRERGVSPSQEPQSAESQPRVLLGRKVKTRFFGEFDLALTRVNGESVTLAGAFLGLSLNRRFQIGVGGYGNTTMDDVEGEIPKDLYLNPNYQPFGYGGIRLAYAFWSDRVVHLRAALLMGAGALEKARALTAGSENVSVQTDVFYVLEPELSLQVNLTRSLRYSLGASYRIIDKAQSPIDGFSFRMGLQIGG